MKNKHTARQIFNNDFSCPTPGDIRQGERLKELLAKGISRTDALAICTNLHVSDIKRTRPSLHIMFGGDGQYLKLRPELEKIAQEMSAPQNTHRK